MSDPMPKSLDERLSEIRQRFETGETPSEIVDVLSADIDRLLAERVSDKARNVGDVVSMACTVKSKETECSLRSLASDRFLVLTWFRGNW